MPKSTRPDNITLHHSLGVTVHDVLILLFLLLNTLLLDTLVASLVAGSVGLALGGWFGRSHTARSSDAIASAISDAHLVLDLRPVGVVSLGPIWIVKIILEFKDPDIK